MSKGKARFTEASLDAMGLEPDGNGGFRPKRSQVGNQDKQDIPILELVADKLDFSEPETTESDQKVEVIARAIERYIEDDSEKASESFLKELSSLIHPPIHRPTPKSLTTLGTEAYNGLIRVLPYDIPSLKELTGKRRKETLEAISRDAYEFIKANRLNSVFIPGNVSSSKNSKEIFTYKKYNDKRVLETKYSLSDSKTVKEYRKKTGDYYAKYKDDFLRLAEGKPFPLLVEFTFIRDSLRRFDFQNAIQLPADMMADAGFIPDDESVYFIPVFNPVVFYSKEFAGVVIKVL